MLAGEMAVLSLAVEEPRAESRRIEFEVLGTPQGQGSTRAFHHRSTGKLIVTSTNRNLRPWRLDVKVLAGEAMAGQEVMAGAVLLRVVFRLSRPKDHFGRSGLLRDRAPQFPIKYPDLDKLVRGLCDGLKEARVYRDDSQVVRLVVDKVFADPPGAQVVVEEL
jgi:Holliday junction resolvase RusA-like endonuclease